MIRARTMHEFSTAATTKFGDSPRILGEFLGQSPNSVALCDKNLCIILSSAFVMS